MESKIENITNIKKKKKYAFDDQRSESEWVVVDLSTFGRDLGI
jgi:hypothetical protein